MPHRKKILLSDSNEAFSMLLTDSLRERGDFRVFHARDADETTEVLHRHRPHVLLLDFLLHHNSSSHCFVHQCTIQDKKISRRHFQPDYTISLRYCSNSAQRSTAFATSLLYINAQIFQMKNQKIIHFYLILYIFIILDIIILI